MPAALSGYGCAQRETIRHHDGRPHARALSFACFQQPATDRSPVATLGLWHPAPGRKNKKGQPKAAGPFGFCEPIS